MQYSDIHRRRSLNLSSFLRSLSRILVRLFTSRFRAEPDFRNSTMPRTRRTEANQDKIIPLALAEVQLAVANAIEGDRIDEEAVHRAVQGYQFSIDGSLGNSKGETTRELKEHGGFQRNLMRGVAQIFGIERRVPITDQVMRRMPGNDTDGHSEEEDSDSDEKVISRKRRKFNRCPPKKQIPMRRPARVDPTPESIVPSSSAKTVTTPQQPLREKHFVEKFPCQSVEHDGELRSNRREEGDIMTVSGEMEKPIPPLSDDTENNRPLRIADNHAHAVEDGSCMNVDREGSKTKLVTEEQQNNTGSGSVYLTVPKKFVRLRSNKGRRREGDVPPDLQEGIDEVISNRDESTLPREGTLTPQDSEGEHYEKSEGPNPEVDHGASSKILHRHNGDLDEQGKVPSTLPITDAHEDQNSNAVGTSPTKSPGEQHSSLIEVKHPDVFLPDTVDVSHPDTEVPAHSADNVITHSAEQISLVAEGETTPPTDEAQHDEEAEPGDEPIRDTVVPASADNGVTTSAQQVSSVVKEALIPGTTKGRHDRKAKPGHESLPDTEVQTESPDNGTTPVEQKGSCVVKEAPIPVQEKGRHPAEAELGTSSLNGGGAPSQKCIVHDVLATPTAPGKVSRIPQGGDAPDIAVTNADNTNRATTLLSPGIATPEHLTGVLDSMNMSKSVKVFSDYSTVNKLERKVLAGTWMWNNKNFAGIDFLSPHQSEKYFLVRHVDPADCPETSEHGQWQLVYIKKLNKHCQELKEEQSIDSGKFVANPSVFVFDSTKIGVRKEALLGIRNFVNGVFRYWHRQFCEGSKPKKAHLDRIKAFVSNVASNVVFVKMPAQPSPIHSASYLAANLSYLTSNRNLRRVTSVAPDVDNVVSKEVTFGTGKSKQVYHYLITERDATRSYGPDYVDPLYAL